MAAGTTSSTRRATIYQLADDPSSPWCPLARRALDDLETQDTERRRLQGANLTGLQATVWVLYAPWSRNRFSFRALANATGTTPHNIEKHYHKAVRALAAAPPVEPDADALQDAWENYCAFVRLTESAPPAAGRKSPDLSGLHGITVNARGTRWPEERWRPPSTSGSGYGPARVLPQDADAERDVLVKVDTLATIEVEDGISAGLGAGSPAAGRRACRSGADQTIRDLGEVA